MLQRAHLTIGEKKPGGTQLMLYLLAKAKELNVPIVYTAKAVELLDNPQNGKVIGVKVKSKEGFEEYFGKYGVVMATGGFLRQQDDADNDGRRSCRQHAGFAVPTLLPAKAFF